MFWVGILAAMVLLVAAQEWFYEQHRRRYGLWRSTRERRLWASPDERVLMWRAFTHRDPDPGMKRVRRTTIALVVLSFAVAASFFALQVSA